MSVPDIQIIELISPNSLQDCQSEWQSLVDNCSRATIYQTWNWNAIWWKHFGRRKRLRLLKFVSNGQTIGIAPLYVSNHFGTPLKRLAWIGTGASDYLDLIAVDGFGGAVSQAFLNYLTHSTGFDLADLQQMRPSSHLRETVPSEESSGKTGLSWILQEPCPYIPLTNEWDTQVTKFGKKMRTNIGYYDRLLARDFSQVETRLTGETELASAMDSLFLLHQQRWRSRLLPGVMGGARIQSFHREIAAHFQSRDELRLHVTYVDGKPVAALYCFRYCERYYYYLGGFDPELSKYSLGTVLTAHAIKQAILDGCTEFDFLRGDEPYKYRWTEHERHNFRLLASPSTGYRSRAMVRLNDLERDIEHRAKEFAANRGRSKSK